MSRAVSPDERRESDAYMTEPKVARFLVGLLLERGHLGRGNRILEPSAGDGSFLAPLAELVPDSKVTANDVTLPDERQRAWHDAGSWLSTCGRFEDIKRSGPGIYDGFDAIVGNPPYSLAEEHVRHALKLLSHGGVCAFLLRLAFLESTKRIPFWNEHKAQAIYVLAERPSFMGGKTDSTAYGMFVWKKGVATHSTSVEVVSWGGRDVARKQPRAAVETIVEETGT